MIWKFPHYDIETGIDWISIENRFDWFQDMKSVEQDKIWHAEGNVQIHTMMVCEQLIALPEFDELDEQEKHIMVTSALMHDIEKRSTTTIMERNGRDCVVAPKHAERGEKTARTILYREFDCPYYVREQICKIVNWHGKPLHTNTEKNIITMATQVSLKYLAMISKADILGRTCTDAKENLDKIEFFQMLGEELDCFETPRVFQTSLAEYTYLSEDVFLDYVPFDETKFEVRMMSALPGSGKDTYIKKHLSDWGVVSIDDIRVELKVKPTDKSGNGRAIQLAKERAKEYMRRKENFVWNATNITAQLRGQIIDLFKSYGAKVTIVYVEVPYKQLIKQNNDREAGVPKPVIEKMIGKLEPPLMGEAHRLMVYLDM